MSDHHRPVLLAEAVEGLAIVADGIYIDATFGRGGHTQAILQRLGPNGRVLAMDKDNSAVEFARETLTDKRFVIQQGSFVMLKDWVTTLGLAGKINGVLFDLGVSSPQLDDPARGFSFMREGPLDMRMDQSRGMSAAEWLANASESEIIVVLKDFGEERFAKRIAHAIVTARAESVLTSTAQLAEIIARAVPRREPGKHPATRSFQGIRIFLNQELEDIKLALAHCLEILAVGGRIAAISFHSLEDRIVKRFMRQAVRGEVLPKELPSMSNRHNVRMTLCGKAIKPSTREINENPRARSAVLRIAEKPA